MYYSTTIGKALGVPVDLVQVTAWLHDIGYYQDPENHRAVGANAVENRLKVLGFPEKEISYIVDGVRNHGSKDTPETVIGHIIRLADALATWDPQYISFYLPVSSANEIEKYSSMLEKKEHVIKEYMARWDFVRGLFSKMKEKTLKVISIAKEI